VLRLVIIIISLFVASCTPSFPRAPSVTTGKARQCLKICQQQYNSCVRECTGTSLEAPSRDACRSECIELLEMCYDQ
jgi:hypothetical protein